PKGTSVLSISDKTSLITNVPRYCMLRSWANTTRVAVQADAALRQRSSKLVSSTLARAKPTRAKSQHCTSI
ncbi:MAG: hypothetical protein KHX99_04950, partial [Atopobium sp.]|nr:hypothetical protein [Atopobium sp.]